MGFPLELCAGADENHIAEFICVICTALAEAPVLTECSHVFCQGCLEQWVHERQNHRCPTCQAALHQAAQPLQKASPLAWRVLGRVRVNCPLVGCAWKGEYSEVAAHLTSSQSHIGSGGGASTAQGLREQAELKEEARCFKEAITLYSKSLAAQPLPLTLVGRGRAWLHLDQPAQALSDGREALGLDPSCSPATALVVRALVQLGRFDEAVRTLDAVSIKDESLAQLEATVDSLVAAEKAGTEAYDAGDFAKARQLFATVANVSKCHSAQLSVARAELAMGLCDQAIRSTRDVLRDDPSNCAAFALRGQAYLLQGDFESAWKHLQEALRLDPDDAPTQHAAKKSRKIQRAVEGAKAAIFRREFAEAAQLATVAIETANAPMRAPLRAQLYAERATARLRLKEYDKCLEDCAHAIYGSDNESKSASLTRASALHALGRHEEALSDMAALLKTWENDPAIKHAYHRANFEVRKMRRPDLYGLLKVPSVASVPEIKAAYRQRALELHPDRVPANDVEGKKQAEARFKELGEALELLTDEFKRKLWDEGYDREAIEERVQAAQRAAREHTRDHCSGH